MSTGFQNIQKAHNIALYVSMWIFYRISHSRLGSQITYGIKFLFFKKSVYRFCIIQVCFNELMIFIS